MDASTVTQWIVSGVSLFAVPVLVAGLKWVLQRINAQKLTLIKSLVAEGIKGIQQLFPALAGSIKKEKVIAWVVVEAKNFGISVSATILDTLIESVLIELKKDFGDAWSSTVTEETTTTSPG